MRHHDGAYHPGRHPPAGRVRKLPLVAAAGERQIVGAGEILAEVMGGGHLQRLPIHHHALDRGRVLGSGELFGLRFPAGEHRDRTPFFRDLSIALEHARHLFLRLGGGFVKRVAFLPEKLAGAQEEAGFELPAEHVVPLVRQHRQVAVRLDVIPQHAGDHRL